MANNKKRRTNNPKPENAKVQSPVVEEDDELDVPEEKTAPAMTSAERAKQSKENRQNALLLIGVIAVLAVVGLVIWFTSGSGDEETAAAAGTAEVAAADTTAAEAVTEGEEAETAGTEVMAFEGEEAVEAEGEEAAAAEGEEAAAAEGEEAAAAEGEEAAAAEGEEAAAAEGTETAAPAGQEITSSTVMNSGEVYSITQDMKMYAEPSTSSEVVMDISGAAGWAVAIEEAAEQGNGWHRVSVWLQGAPTYGYIQIP